MRSAGWRVPINVKLLAVLAVPVVGYVVIASGAVVRAQFAANNIRDQASVVKTAVGPTSLTTSLIDERTITLLESAGLADELTLRIGSSTEARRATDEQLAALQTLIDENPEARENYTDAVDGLAEGIKALRAEVDAGTIDDAAVLGRYGDYVTSLINANAAAVERVNDAEFWQGAKLSELATRQKDARALLVNSLVPVSMNGGNLTDLDQTVELVRSLSGYENRDGAISELATGEYAQAGSVLVEALDAADLAELARRTLETGRLDQAELFDVASYKGGFVYDLPSGDYIHDYFRARVVEILEQNAADRTAAADRRLRTYAILGFVGLVLTGALTYLVSRSIMRPLRSLTQQVIDTATHRLPATVHDILETPLGEDVDWPHLDPIAVPATDEVGDVADAFNTMQQSALDLAVEEAILRRHITDSLVTLGQRNQGLLNRQLSFINALERNESDPDTLADLYYLDHLAVRMRRNAELLLVLAGVDPPRKWVGPTPVGNIIRAALGEAAEYKRVRVQDVQPVAIAGSATAELSHLLAELIENALLFSPPGDTVEVYGRHRMAEDGSSDGYTVTVEDHGVGMSDEEIAQANRRLAATESSSVAPSKYMGHYIAGKLAARHGIVARLRSNGPGNGLTATIDIPPGLLTAEAHADTVTALPPLPPLPREVPVMPLPPQMPLEPLSPLTALPPLPDSPADRSEAPQPDRRRPDAGRSDTGRSGSAGSGGGRADAPQAESPLLEATRAEAAARQEAARSGMARQDAPRSDALPGGPAGPPPAPPAPPTSPAPPAPPAPPAEPVPLDPAPTGPLRLEWAPTEPAPSASTTGADDGHGDEPPGEPRHARRSGPRTEPDSEAWDSENWEADGWESEGWESERWDDEPADEPRHTRRSRRRSEPQPDERPEVTTAEMEPTQELVDLTDDAPPLLPLAEAGPPTDPAGMAPAGKKSRARRKRPLASNKLPVPPPAPPPLGERSDSDQAS